MKLFKVTEFTDKDHIFYTSYITSKALKDIWSPLNKLERSATIVSTVVECLGMSDKSLPVMYHSEFINTNTVEIYCKIGADTFPSEPWNIHSQVTSEQVVNFLLSDACNVWDENEKNYPGDKVIWYLCSNIKFGIVTCRDNAFNWQRGHSSPTMIRTWIYKMKEIQFITEDQEQLLLKECDFVDNNFTNHFSIRDYIIQQIKFPKKNWLKS